MEMAAQHCPNCLQEVKGYPSDLRKHISGAKCRAQSTALSERRKEMQAALAAKDAEMEAALAAKDAEMEAALAAKEEEM